MRQELETANTFKVALTMSQVVVEDDAFIQELVEAMESQTMPVWDFQGVLKGRNGTEERMVYRECIPSGQVDLQNITVGDVIKRAWNFAVNRPPKLQNLHRWIKKYSAIHRRVPRWHPPFNFNNIF